MDKRYQVFISSTFTDLQEERKQVIQALLELDCIPAGMELFPASDDDQWTLIQKVIDDSDYYIVVIGGRYGSTTLDGLSFTEREYDYAISAGKPVLGFLHAAPDKIEAGRTDKNEEAQQKLVAFREKVQQKMCKHWRTAEELGGVVSRGVINVFRSHPAEGWVRAAEALTPELLVEITGLRQKVAELEQELAQSAPQAPAGTEQLAQGDEAFGLKFTVRRRPGWTNENLLTKLSWTEILKAVGAAMLGGETPEGELRAAVARLAYAAAVARDSALRGTDSPEVKNFDVVKVQFMALGLIQRGSLKRGVNDKATYWKLTPHGEVQVMQLSAIRRGEGSPAS